MSTDPKPPQRWHLAQGSREQIRAWNEKVERYERRRRQRLGARIARALRRPPDEAVVLELLAWLLLLLLLAVTIRHL